MVAHEGNSTLCSLTSACNSWLTQLQAAISGRCSHDRIASYLGAESEGLQLTVMLKRVPLFRLAGKTIHCASHVACPFRWKKFQSVLWVVHLSLNYFLMLLKKCHCPS